MSNDKGSTLDIEKYLSMMLSSPYLLFSFFIAFGLGSLIGCSQDSFPYVFINFMWIFGALGIVGIIGEKIWKGM